jgi:hypothetical protein
VTPHVAWAQAKQADAADRIDANIKLLSPEARRIFDVNTRIDRDLHD